MRLTTVGIVLIVAGVAIFAFTLVRLIGGSPLDPQTEVPGKVTAEIREPGRYYLWDNHWTRFNDEHVKYSDDCPADAKVTVHDANGTELEFVSDASQSWSIGNNAKTSIGYVEVSAATTLQLNVDDVGRERIVSVSNRTMQQELWLRLGGFGIGVLVGLVGALTALIGLIARRRGASIANGPLETNGR